MKLLLQLYWFSLLLISTNCTQHSPVLADAHQGQEIWRSQEGGGASVRVDTATALPALLQRLSGDWQFVETGKGYWIGYTDDMYSKNQGDKLVLTERFLKRYGRPNKDSNP